MRTLIETEKYSTPMLLPANDLLLPIGSLGLDSFENVFQIFNRYLFNVEGGFFIRLTFKEEKFLTCNLNGSQFCDKPPISGKKIAIKIYANLGLVLNNWALVLRDPQQLKGRDFFTTSSSWLCACSRIIR